MKRVWLVCLLLIWSAFSYSDSISYAKDGKAVWVAFKCSVLAGVFSDDSHEGKLFEIGHTRGERFFTAAMNGKIKRDDINQIVPMAVIFSARGPSADFMLGRVYEAASESALDGLYVNDGVPITEEMRDVRARNRFQSENCELLTEN